MGNDDRRSDFGQRIRRTNKRIESKYNRETASSDTTTTTRTHHTGARRQFPVRSYEFPIGIRYSRGIIVSISGIRVVHFKLSYPPYWSEATVPSTLVRIFDRYSVFERYYRQHFGDTCCTRQVISKRVDMGMQLPGSRIFSYVFSLPIIRLIGGSRFKDTPVRGLPGTSAKDTFS